MLEAQSKRIACALHDEAAQLLVPVHLGLAEVAREVPAEIANDGIGFDAAAAAHREGRPGLGLMERRERLTALGGTLRVQPNEGGGTNLTVEIPLEY